MSHSKRNTSLAFFTSYERESLKSSWGSQSTRLTRDSFLPFGSCQLCLLPATNPVACPSGDLFCRECAMNNLLAQRKEIKRLEKLAEKEKSEEEELKGREEEEARKRAVQEFEAVQMGLNAKVGAGSTVVGRGGGKVVVEKEDEGDGKTGEKRGIKRKFELDEEELVRIAREERSRAKVALDEERRAAQPHLPSFWVPSQTPSTNHASATTQKQNPICPASNPASLHPLSLKSLTTVNFTKEKSEDASAPTSSCPSCHKTLTNATKAMLAIPCGHVVCKPCVEKFLKPEHRHHRDAHDQGPEPETVHCYVCDADLTSAPAEKEKEGKKSKKDKDKGPKPGLVEIRSEGTGFAGAGKSMVKKEGVAFQFG